MTDFFYNDFFASDFWGDDFFGEGYDGQEFSAGSAHGTSSAIAYGTVVVVTPPQVVSGYGGGAGVWVTPKRRIVERYATPEACVTLSPDSLSELSREVAGLPVSRRRRRRSR